MPLPTIEDCKVLVDAALIYSGGSHLYEDIVAGVKDGRYQFWAGPSSIIVTELLEAPRLKTLSFFLAAGSLSEIEQMEKKIIVWGKEQGCGLAVFTGRFGWQRTFLSRTGWGATHMVFQKSLTSAV